MPEIRGYFGRCSALGYLLVTVGGVTFILLMRSVASPGVDLFSTGTHGNPVQTNQEYQTSIWDTRRSLSNSALYQGTRTCLDGQGIQNMPPICGNPTCLQDLIAPSPNHPREVTLTAEDLAFIEQIPPNNNVPQHANIVNMLTHIQWSHAVYGTVGEIGLHNGRFTVVLALHTDTDRGERLFACDVYDKLGHGYVELDLQNQVKNENWTKTREGFLETMAKIGFTPDHANIAKRLHFWFDSSAYLTKTVFLQMGLPSVRLMSVDGYHYDTFVWQELVQTMCVLRNGGILIIDDITSSWSAPIKTALEDFHRMVSSKIISPLVLYKNKLYITSSEWHDIYIKDIEAVLKTRTDIPLTKGTFVANYTRNNLMYFREKFP